MAPKPRTDAPVLFRLAPPELADARRLADELGISVGRLAKRATLAMLATVGRHQPMPARAEREYSRKGYTDDDATDDWRERNR
jgi:hypothetical protein